MPKWIFVTGGVLSGLGKGLISASVSKLLQERDQQIVPLKCDGYLNVDPGTMNPHEHGEVFVLDDGTEVDMDFGHYERFLDVEGRGDWNLTSGKIFQEVIEKEREGEYLGKTVQMVPHVTGEIKDSWRQAAEEKDADIIAVEVGGTVGDIENMLYLEAIRQLRSELPEEQIFHIHATLVPYLETTGEQKTKPTQHSVKELRETGLEPDMIVGRSEEKLQEDTSEKIALFCDVKEEAVISDPNIEHVYELPLLFDQQNADEIVAEKMNLPERENGMKNWEKKVENLKKGDIARIAICGKYTDMDDSYVSVEAALKHAAAEIGGNVEIEQLATENFKPEEELEDFDGIVIPGGFGKRGVEGKIEAARYCRENNVPLLGLCYGLQLMTIEYARNVLGLDATSAEFENGEEHVVIDEMPEQKNIEEMGGTMRLGSYTAELQGQVKKIYGKEEASERHRHRYEVNNEYTDQLEESGLKISGKNKEKDLVEYIELPENDYFIGTQAHPEFTSRFTDPNPLYLSFLQAASQ
ncbi:MAG: CTP synthase [Candidatus Nanohalobium sp.]